MANFPADPAEYPELYNVAFHDTAYAAGYWFGFYYGLYGENEESIGMWIAYFEEQEADTIEEFWDAYGTGKWDA